MSAAARAGRAAAASLALLLPLACDTARELRAQQSAGGVLRALELLRDADNSSKAKALAGLARAPCLGEGVCEVRDACRDAYALHVEGVTLTAAAKQRLADGNPLEAANLVGSAEEKLKSAGGKVDACIQQAGALRRRYEL